MPKPWATDFEAFIRRYADPLSRGERVPVPASLTQLVVFELAKIAFENLWSVFDSGKLSWKEPYLQIEFERQEKWPFEPDEDTTRPVDISAVAFAVMYGLTRLVFIHQNRLYWKPEATEEQIRELETIPEKTLAAGYAMPPLQNEFTIDTPDGPSAATFSFQFAIRPLTIEGDREEIRRMYYPIHAGLEVTKGIENLPAWSEKDFGEVFKFYGRFFNFLTKQHLKAIRETGMERPPIPKPDRVKPIPPSEIIVAGGYFRPIFGLSERKRDRQMLMEFHEPQTPLNWAVGLAMFSLTDADKVKAGDWQEASIRDLEDRVFRLTEDRPRRGDHRDDILAEVVKLHTKRNWYYEIETVQVGRAWTNRATIGSQYAIPEIQLIFLDKKTGKRTFPSDPAIRSLLVPLEVKGRSATKPDGKDIPSLPKDRWQPESVRWRWVQAFNDDLLLTPALHEAGKRKGLPKKSTTGKPIRKGYLIKVADNIFTALGKLRAEGSGSKYACRLLIMLASNLNKTEDGIAADRVFRMLGIPEDYQAREHRKPEDVVARAVLRLKERDIRALLVGSDEYPRTDPNPERRKGPYYCFRRSAEYTPRGGIVTKEDALAIEAEYETRPEAPVTGPKNDQPALPGFMPDTGPIPSGADIRAAREAAGITLRRFAETVSGGSFNTWARYERGESIRVGSIDQEVWQRVRDFIAQHRGKE